MFLSDFHIHSLFSEDSKSKIDFICENAILNGISEICITDHIDLLPSGVDGGWSFDIERQTKTVDEAAKKYEGQLTVRTGAELGQINHNVVLAKKLSLQCHDFVIGSVHNLSGRRYIHLLDYENLDIDAFFCEYLGEVEEIIDINISNCWGHFDYPFRYMSPNVLEKFELNSYFEHIEVILKKMVKNDMALEFNTSKFKLRPDITEKMREILKIYRGLGGETVTIGSDSHLPNTVGFCAMEASEILKELGFKYAATFKNKKCIFNKLY